MFDDLLESTVEKKKTNKGWSVILSGAVQAFILGILILIPLIYTEALPKAMLSTLLIAPPPPPPPPPPPAPVKTIVKPVARLIQSGKLMQPRAIPKEVAVFKEAELPPDVITNSGQTGGVFGGIPGQGMVSGPAVPPPPKPTAPARIKQGGNVTAASIITQTRPVYPPLARQARIQGNVVLHAIIDKDGKVAQLEVISGHPLLVQSALDAVKQWRYKPTLLNGDPVEVDTTITVTFTMGG
ncbi:MAG TPA: TonB family protein [Candidatus Acidoferrales bacterium]|nr:TonB family protein [Candidatus Acidoferrales bacterium]